MKKYIDILLGTFFWGQLGVFEIRSAVLNAEAIRTDLKSVPL